MRSSPLAVLIAAVLVDMIGFGIILPLLPFYAESMGASPLEVTLLFASFAGMQLAAAPFWGRVSDRVGRRPLIVLSLFAGAASHLIFGLADVLWLLFVSRMAAGAAGGTITLAQAYVADSTRADDRAQAMGWIGAAAGLGVFIGPWIGGWASQWGLGTAGFVASGLCALNGLAAVFFLPESGRRRSASGAFELGEAATWRGWLGAMTRFPVVLLLGIYFLTISSFNAMTAVLALYLERVFGIGAQEMGNVLALAGGTTVLVRGFLLGPLVRWIGETDTARFGVLSLGAGILLVPVLPNVWWLGLAVPLWALGAGTLFPSLATLVSRATDEGSQGAVLGGSQVVGGLGRVIGPVWAGVLFQQVTIGTPFFVAGLLVGAAALLGLRLPASVRAPESAAAAPAAEGA